jgi:hypothetical protein
MAGTNTLVVERTRHHVRAERASALETTRFNHIHCTDMTTWPRHV